MSELQKKTNDEEEAEPIEEQQSGGHQPHSHEDTLSGKR